jgi:GNAT superfamily N-acetyltransferase
MTLLIRHLRPDDDAAAVGSLVQQAYFSLEGYPRDSYYDAVLGDVAGRSHEADVLVGVLAGRIVACLTFLRDHHNPHAQFDDPKATSFRYFGVDPAVQGQGVGEAMVKWCIHETRRTGHRRMRIHTLESMPGAQRLYVRLGFERDPQHDADWDGVKGLAYVLHL